MSKLNPNAQKWVDALRSGKYKQGKMRLRTGVGFCCLGVACDVFKKELGIRWYKRKNGTYSIVKLGGCLPEIVRRHIGLTTENGAFRNDTLAGRNDWGGYSLSGIADLIEEHAEELGVSA